MRSYALTWQVIFELPGCMTEQVYIYIYNGRNGSFYVAGYFIEERRRWSVITASPRGQCSK